MDCRGAFAVRHGDLKYVSRSEGPKTEEFLFDIANDLNRSKEPKLATQLKGLAGVLGLLQRDPVAFLQAGPANNDGLTAEEIDAKVSARNTAKKARNYAEADRIRDELKAAGIILEDGPGGTTWRRG